MESMNDELRLAAHKLSLLLDVSNLLDMPGALEERVPALARIIEALPFANAGLVLITHWGDRDEVVMGATGFPAALVAPEDDDVYVQSVDWGAPRSHVMLAVCRHTDGAVIEFDAEAQK